MIDSVLQKPTLNEHERKKLEKYESGQVSSTPNYLPEKWLKNNLGLVLVPTLFISLIIIILLNQYARIESIKKLPDVIIEWLRKLF